MKNKPIVKDRLFSRLLQKGQLFKKPSVTIPGQALSPQEIMKLYVKNRDNIKPQFSDQNFDSFNKMDQFEKMDLSKKLSKDINDLSDILQKQKKHVTQNSEQKTTTTTNDDDENK